MIRLIRELIRPYRGKLLIILAAMLVETAMSLANPWPLKIICIAEWKQIFTCASFNKTASENCLLSLAV